MPAGKIGNLTIGRPIMGGNQFSGWSHSRDLKYLRDLFKAYATPERIMQTLEMAEESGINTILSGEADYITKHNREQGGKMQWFAFKVLAAGAIHPSSGLQYAFENGADFVCVGMFDFHIRENTIITKNAVAACQTRPRPWQA